MQGGIADHTAYLAQHITPLGVTPTVLISRRWTEQSSSENSSLIPVYPILPNWGWRCWRDCARFLAKNRPDVLHVQYQAAAFDLGGWVNWLPWYLRKQRTACKVVTTFHDLRIPYIFPKAGPFRWKSILTLAAYSDAVICTNREDLHALSRELGKGETSPRLTHIPLGSNVEVQPPADFDRAAWRATYLGKANDALLLAYFGFLNDSKGGEELIKALALLRLRGINAHLLLIGGDVGHADPTNVAYAQKIQALIDSLGLTDVVHRTGYVIQEHVSANLLAADAIVMPYRDGISFRRTTVIAALRHGCPVITTQPTNPDFVPEVLPDENMLLVPPQDPAALAETISLLTNNPQLRQKLSNGAQSLGHRFEWDEIAAQTAALYQAAFHSV